MGVYLNPSNEKFKENLNNKIYVDKTMLIKETNERIGRSNEKFLCISRPRRFGKTIATNMLMAYYSKGCDSKELFKNLKIAKDPSFEEHLNKYDVIYIDFAGVDGRSDNKDEIVSNAQRYVCNELKQAFPNIIPDKENKVADFITAIALKYPCQKFIVIIDEYDLIFREDKYSEKLRNEYLDFLNSLFKNNTISECIALAYLTGILPVIRQNFQSKLNEFINISMLKPFLFAQYVGFTEEEVKELCDKYNMDFLEMKRWYNGYRFRNNVDIYCPRSVVLAIMSHEYDDYWVETSSAEALLKYVKMNYDGLQDDVERLIAGEKVPVKVVYFDNTITSIKCKDDVLTYFIHLGYLAYDAEEKSCYIPNYEIQQEWVNSIERLGDYSYVVNYINKSKKLLEETLKGNAKKCSQNIR